LLRGNNDGQYFMFAGRPVIFMISLEDFMRWFLAALFMIVGCLGATQAIAERRVALVIGNSKYAYTPALSNPHNDAEDIAGALTKVGFEVTVGYDLDQVRFAGMIDEFARALEGADVGMFFYAGHGLQINDRNYLVSTGAKLESAFLVPSETIEVDALIRMMESKAGTNLIFLDACRNNPLTDNLKRNLAATHRAVTVGRGLAAVSPTGRDTLVAFSAAPGELATDGMDRNSPFAASLVRHLPKPGLEVSVMLKEVAADVRRETNNAQRPQQLSDMTKTFYFAKAAPAVEPAAPAVPPPPVAPVDPVEVAFWQSASAANECDSVRAYLRQYPTGKFVELAHIAERRLCRAAEVAPPPAPAPERVPAPPQEALERIPGLLQTQLKRVGCDPGTASGDWGAGSRRALENFNRYAGTNFNVQVATRDAYDAVRAAPGRVCPLVCERGSHAEGEACVPIKCEAGFVLGSDDTCHKRPERPSAPTARRPSGHGGGGGGGGNCISFGGRRVCE
jgi:hypothetical protein